jgi:hypothetical protein
MEVLDVISLCEGQTDFIEMPEEEVPKCIQELEDSLDLQRKKGELDTGNNLELLRYFQMFPTEAKLEQVCFMLGMGLSKIPERDFVTYYSMLSKTMVRKIKTAILNFFSDIIISLFPLPSSSHAWRDS